MKVLWPFQEKLDEFINGDERKAQYYDSLKTAIDTNKDICGLDVVKWRTEMHKWAIKRREEILCEYVQLDENSLEVRVKGYEAIIYFTITK
jgi:hypothetical protein